jgi:hypothetical protein
MNINALRDALALLLKTSPAPLVEAAADAPRGPARAVGQSLQAQIVSELANGRFLIEIEGSRLDVKLPVAARVGDTLKLQVLALEPRLTFALVREPASAGADAVAMSESARKLTAVVERLSREAPLPAIAAPPVLASPPGDTAAFAASLKSALSRSGLFYESHQAQWVAGERALGELMQEPQAALKGAPGGVHPQAIGLVQQQLEIVDTRQLLWQGDVWPNQSLEWRIEEEPRRDTATGDAPPVWKTTLRLSLPRLGEVSATLAIRGDQVHLAFSDLVADTKSAVKSGQVALRDAFGNAGLELLEIKVDRDES